MPKYISGARFGELCNMSRQAIHEAKKAGKVHQDPVSKKYDINHQVNALFLSVSSKMNEVSLNDLQGAPQDLKDLYEIKLREEIRRIKATADKAEYELAMKRKDIVPSRMVAVYIGCFRSAISTNLLSLGQNISRNDKQLRDRIDSFVTKGLKRAIEQANRALQKEGERMVELIEEVDNEKR
jgi:gas vesicle protein